MTYIRTKNSVWIRSHFKNLGNNFHGNIALDLLFPRGLVYRTPGRFIGISLLTYKSTMQDNHRTYLHTSQHYVPFVVHFWAHALECGMPRMQFVEGEEDIFLPTAQLHLPTEVATDIPAKNPAGESPQTPAIGSRSMLAMSPTAHPGHRSYHGHAPCISWD